MFVGGSNPKEIDWFPAEEVIPIENYLKSINYDDNYALFQVGRWELKYFDRDCILGWIKQSGDSASIREAEEQHSDLITGKYEGIFWLDIFVLL